MRKVTLKMLDHRIQLQMGEPEDWDFNTLGVANLHNNRITIRDSIPNDKKRSVFCHELLHIIADMHSIELTEQDVDAVSLGINSFITNNLKWINETWKS